MGCTIPLKPVAGWHRPGGYALKVVVSDTIFEDLEPEREALRGLAELEVVHEWPGRDAFLQTAHDADGIICQMAPLREDVIDGLERCRVIVRYGVGVDNVDVEAATRRGIAVCNVPDYCTDEVADHTVTLALALIRRLGPSVDALRRGYWGYEELRPVHRISALRVGIYGFGRIARAVARRFSGFGCALSAHDPYVALEVFHGEGVRSVDEQSLLGETDLLALHMPLTPETRHLICRETLSRMKPGAMLVNTARGGLIDTNALLAALDRGRLAGAALDVMETEPIPPDHPLVRHPRAIVTGHLAWYSEEALQQLKRSVGEECARVLRGEAPRNPVNPAYLANARVSGDVR